MRAGRIYMIGPSFETQGGISTVLSIYRKQLSDTFEMAFVASYSGRSRVFDYFYFTSALLKVFMICLLKRRPVFHIHMSTGGSYIRKSLLAKLCMLFRKKVILHIHGADYDTFIDQVGSYLKKDIIALLNKADALIVLSESWRDYFTRFVDSEKIEVLYNPCELIEGEYRERKNQAANILFTGRMGLRKGTYDIVEAAYRLKHLEYKLELYGDGEVDVIRKLVREKGLEEKVLVNGWLPHSSIFPLYQRADFLVLPSYAEGMPMSVLEAMGAGLPVVSTFVGGIPEMIDNDINGFLIKPGDVDALTEKMEALITDAGLCRNMGREALKKANEKFSIEVSRNKLMKIYSKLYPAV